jgi:A118 family predicted phage portal protein
MNIISSAVSFIKGLFSKKMNSEQVLKIFRVRPVISQNMANLQRLFLQAYEGKMPHNLDQWNMGKKTPGIPSLFIAATICERVAKDVITDLNTEVLGNEFIDAQYQRFVTALKNNIKSAVEKCNAGGMVALRPYFYNGEIFVSIVDVDNFIVTETNTLKEITGIVFRETFAREDKYYTLYEFHNFMMEPVEAKNGQPATMRGRYEIKYKATVSTSADTDGEEIAVKSIDRWATLEDVTIGDVARPWFVIVSMPGENIFERGSIYSLPLFAKALNTIAEADINAMRADREVAVSERMIDIPESMLVGSVNETGIEYELPDTRNKIFRKIPGFMDESTQKPEYYGGDPNVDGYETYQQKLYRMIEDECDLYNGMLSDPPSVERTATEVISSRRDYAAMIMHQQETWRDAMEALIVVMGEMAAFQGVGTTGGTLQWEAGEVAVLTREQEFKELTALMGMGVISTEYMSAWYFGQPITDELRAVPAPLEMEGEDEEARNLQNTRGNR